jgi:Tfp pilus assembly protein PilX
MRSRIHNSTKQKGSVSVFVLVVIALMAGLLLARAKNTISRHRHTRHDAQHLQTTQLANAGMRIAERAWQDSTEPFQFEWELLPGTVHQTNSGRVTIVTTADGDCTVVAQFPTNVDLPFRVTRTQGFSQ